jgi:uncharacterized phage protein (TIGR01671 family)
METSKLRAWDADRQVMYYSDDTLVGNCFHIGSLGFLGIEHGNGDWRGGAGLILMQFTGVEDKTGKEIYEDDIVEYETFCSNGRITYVVEWEQDELRWPQLLRDAKKGGTVIGNIYENPGLLVGVR